MSRPDGTDANRHIWESRFCMTSAGNFCGKTGTTDTGGWTDYPIGLTFNGDTAAGGFVAVVAGADANGYLYLDQKRYAADPWSGWFQMAGSPQTRLGPTVRVANLTGGNYEIMFGR